MSSAIAREPNPPIEVTERAREALAEALAAKGKNTIRLYVDGFG